jgi:hypothetical protein
MDAKKYLITACLFALLMLIPGVAHASSVANVIYALPGDGWHTDMPAPGQNIPIDAVQSELSYLNQNKMFDSVAIDVYLYNQQVYRVSEGANVPYGGTSFGGNIYIFSGYWSSDDVSSAIVHEIGHMIRRRFVSDSELQAYMTMRGVKDQVLMNGVTTLKEELFAEDFRTLFGDQHAQVPQYDFYKTIALPDAQDKAFILNCIGGSTVNAYTPLTPAVPAGAW